jgi:hypothetical protein
LLAKDIGSWSTETDNQSEPLLVRMESKWETLAALLWSCHVFKELPQPWHPPPDRPNIYRLTGIMPAKPSSVLYWIRGFEHVEQQEQGNRGLRPLAQVQMEYRRASAWMWRCIMSDVERLGENDKLGSILANFHRGLGGASQIALADQLIPFGVDNDFGVPGNYVEWEAAAQQPLVPFRQLGSATVDRIRSTVAGRLEALLWAMDDKGSIDECESRACDSGRRMEQLERGVEALWFSSTAELLANK